MNNNYNGIINIYKEQGFTSFDVVAKLRGILKMRKIGHTGTLDPDATGVLPVVLGNATKLVDMLTDKQKEYVAEFKFGLTSDTQDIWGKILSESPVTCDESEVEKVIKSFIGDIEQIPPMYSAIKVDGKKLYELAREGKEIERKPRPVKIIDIEILKIELPYVSMRVVCSKGTYIRTLCHDIGQKLACGAVMTKLTRTVSGQFTIDGALKLSEVEQYMSEGRIEEFIIPVDSVFDKYVRADLRGELLAAAKNGNKLRERDVVKCLVGDGERTKVRMYDSDGIFFALYNLDREKHLYGVDKMFLS